MREGEELKAPRHASAAASYDDHVTTRDIIANTGNSSFVVAIYIYILLNWRNKYQSSLLTIAIII